MNNNVLLLLCFVILSCNFNQNRSNLDLSNLNMVQSIPNLVNTIWELKVTGKCINRYEFVNDNNFTFYSCEMEENFKGTYYIKNDTLYLIEMSENNSDESIKYSIIANDNKLQHVERFSFSIELNKWVKDKFIFDDTLLYNKIK